MSNEIEIMKSLLPLGGGVLAFSAALLNFISSRLQAATTLEARYSLFGTVFGIVQLLIIVAGLTSYALGMSVLVVVFMFLSLLVQAGLFVWLPSNQWRSELVYMIAMAMAVVIQLNGLMLTDYSHNLREALAPQKQPAKPADGK